MEWKKQFFIALVQNYFTKFPIIRKIKYEIIKYKSRLCNSVKYRVLAKKYAYFISNNEILVNWKQVKNQYKGFLILRSFSM